MIIKGIVQKITMPKVYAGKDGKEYSNQEVIIETMEQYPQKISLNVKNEKVQGACIKLADGKIIEADCVIKASKYPGLNSITMWRFNVVEG